MPRIRYDPSRDRQRLRRLEAEFAKIVDVFRNHQPLLRASLQTLRRRCGKSGCRCRRGTPHETLVLVDRSRGRRKVRKVQRGEYLRLKKLTRRYQTLRRLRARLSKLHAEVLQCCDRLFEHRLRDGGKLER